MSYLRIAGRALATVGLVAGVAALAGQADAAARTIHEFTIKAAGSQPGDMTVGADSNVWFVEPGTNRIGRVTHTGTLSGYPIPTANSKPTGITTGPDGAVWFAEAAADKIGRLVPGPTFKQFALPGGASPRGITAGPDGALWFTEFGANHVGRITTAGAITSFPLTTPNSGPIRIAVGSDGNLWVTESTAAKIARINPTSHAVTEFALPAGSAPSRITAGPDGNLWFAEPGTNRIGRITRAGTITQFSLPTGASHPTGIAAGADGNLWFTEQAGNNIGRITPAGTVTEYPVPTAKALPGGIALGADGNVWFSENRGNKVAYVKDAAGHTNYVIVRDGLYIPQTQAVPLESGVKKSPPTVRWVFEGAGVHTATDATGMGLYDSGAESPISIFSHTFTTAGSFPYHSTAAGDSLNGVVKIAPIAPASGQHGSAFTITLATSVPAGISLDVQVETPGAGTFSPLQSGVTATAIQYTPTSAGTYKFQVRTAQGGSTSDWSPIVRVSVS